MNAFTTKPDVSKFMAAAQRSHVTSNAATKMIAKGPERFNFIINSDNPRHNPLATKQEIEKWKQKKLARIG